MRIALLPLFAALAACDNTVAEDYDAYDPDAPVEEATVEMKRLAPPMRPVVASAVQEPWVNAKGSVFVGFTAPQGGRWQWPETTTGSESGDAACRAQGADHACTLAEIVVAREAGDFAHAPDGVTFWINDEDAGQGASCGNADRHSRGYTYEGADAGWGGYARTSVENGLTRVDIHVPPEVRWDPGCLKDLEVCQSFVPSGYACNAVRAIACCI